MPKDKRLMGVKRSPPQGSGAVNRAQTSQQMWHPTVFDGHYKANATGSIGTPSPHPPKLYFTSLVSSIVPPRASFCTFRFRVVASFSCVDFTKTFCEKSRMAMEDLRTLHRAFAEMNVIISGVRGNTLSGARAQGLMVHRAAAQAHILKSAQS
jgi:hypothetical protein